MKTTRNSFHVCPKCGKDHPNITKGGKQMFYEADLDYRKLKYCNEKKSIRAQEDFDRKLAMYNPEEFTVKKYKVKY